LGSQADLAADMTEGILTSARVILNRQLQIAATEVRRGQGRYTEMATAVASSCAICGNGPPLWEIRARRVIHDQEAQQLYFEGAQLRIIGRELADAPA
jgi:LPS-assembly protein